MFARAQEPFQELILKEIEAEKSVQAASRAAHALVQTESVFEQMAPQRETAAIAKPAPKFEPLTSVDPLEREEEALRRVEDALFG